MQVSSFGAILALVIAIFLIIKKVPPTYGMIIGAVIGGIVGDAGLTGTVEIMITGVTGMSSAIIRIVTAGVLAGALMESGAANKIAEFIVGKLGEKKSLVALTLSTYVLTTVGVFGDVSIITVAPIAIAIGKKAGFSKMGILFAMIGGVKAGNMTSPNPNTIAAAEAFGVELTTLMTAGIIPAFCCLIVTCLISSKLKNKGDKVSLDVSGDSLSSEIAIESEKEDITLFGAIIGPVVSIGLLLLRPTVGIAVDPLIALPVGGIVGTICMGKAKELNNFAISGLGRMSGVVLLLIGTGTIAGIISNSGLKDVIIGGVDLLGLPGVLLAPIAGITMGAATASATAGASVGGLVFGPAILEYGVLPVQGASMVYSGTQLFDGLPHGSFFHVSGGCVSMEMKDRLKLIPYETTIGIVMCLASTIAYGIMGLAF
ncbi:GntP family permease [Terrisporobacter petrolearius]|uniref:GntP family permease n=1 Tax=Terrisporobacter petrolearius TaxID=1460447 RepID=UPI001D16498F|nr:GntP family permease [Terrisporobacter petrolearius]MCC3865695.1 GntP family permease [Terrisporobacter petrolearius]